MRTPPELTSLFRAQGRKITPQRKLLFQLLHDNESHPTAEALYAMADAKLPGISLRTVYQTLSELAEIGELQFIDVGSGATRFDPNVDDHHHVVCDNCGEVRDVHVEGIAQLRPTGADDFTFSDVGILFHGSCKKCKQIKSTNTPKTREKQHGQA